MRPLARVDVSGGAYGEGVGGAWGLTSAEVAARVAAGAVNRVPRGPQRTVAQIVRANTLTLFNLILCSLGALVLVVGDWRDALFLSAVVVNTGVGIVQELRAKATLDRLSVVGEARPRVRRDGRVVEVPPDAIVRDDVVVAVTGDTVVVDGEVLESSGLEVDESLLTGEAEPVAKEPGGPVRSGSFVTAGSGCYRATRVGAEAYAAQLAQKARRFTLVRSDLRDGINTILRVMGVIIIPVGVLLAVTQLRHAGSLAQAVSGAVAGTSTMIPEGLVLLTSVAFAVGVVRLGRRRVLVQELAAIEGLARVDVLCIDKTGTLTEPGMVFDEVVTLDARAPVDAALGALGAAEATPNPTLAAVASARPAPRDWTTAAAVPFSSDRKWSGARFVGRGTWVLGAADVLLDVSDPARQQADRLAAQGRRVLLLARATGGLADPDDLGTLTPVALATLQQRLKPDAADVVGYFRGEGVDVKVLSGDNPRTVTAVLRALDLGGEAVDARTLPTDLDALGAEAEGAPAFGRVSPEQKRALVHALQRRGHTVAMTGDGVNDVLALKDADIGVAMASGSDATRGVAQVVLVDNRFEQMPSVVAEGRRVVTNIESVARLFLTKTAYATTISMLSGVVGLAFPFLPRHLTVISVLTIGVPGFFLALAPNTRRYRPGFVGRVTWFAVPAGTVAALATFITYAVALSLETADRAEATTMASIVLFLVAWWVVVLVSRPLTRMRVLLVVSLMLGFVLVLAVPWTRAFFAFTLPGPTLTLTALLIAAIAIGVLHLVLWLGARVPGCPGDRSRHSRSTVPPQPADGRLVTAARAARFRRAGRARPTTPVAGRGPAAVPRSATAPTRRSPRSATAPPAGPPTAPGPGRR